MLARLTPLPQVSMTFEDYQIISEREIRFVVPYDDEAVLKEQLTELLSDMHDTAGLEELRHH